MSMLVLLYYANRRWNLEDNVTTPMGANRIGSAEPIPEALPEQSQEFRYFTWGDRDYDFDKLDFEFSINQDFKFPDQEKPKQIDSRPTLVHDNVQTSTSIIDASWVNDIELDIDLQSKMKDWATGLFLIVAFRSPIPLIPYWLIRAVETYGPQEEIVYY